MTVFPSLRHREPGAQVSTVAGWRPALILIGLAIVVFGLGFHREATDAVGVWVASTAYNHCFLILPVVGYLLWERRSIIEASSPRPALWPLLLMPLLSAVWFLAAALDINEGRQLLVVAMFEVVLLSALGPRLYRLLLAPLLFLFFLVPSGYFLVPWLQSITADIAVAGLRLLHIPVFSDGYLIDIPEGGFEVAEACAGLRFLIAAGVFSCLFAVVMYRSWVRRGCYIALSIAAAIAANGIRAFGIIYYAHLSGSAAAALADHILYGWLFFSLVIALLIGLGVLLPEKDRPAASAALSPVESAAPRWHTVAIPLAALLAVTGPAYAAWRNSLVPIDPLPATASPTVAAPWHRVDQTAGWRPMVRGADREYLETFEGPGSATVTRYVALYRLHATANRLTLSGNRVADDRAWLIARQGRAQVDLAGDKVAVTKTEIVRGSTRGLVWSFYVVDGRIAGGLFEAKLLQLRAVLRQHRPIGALVIVESSADVGGNNWATNAAGDLSRFFAASQPIPEYISGMQRESEHDR
jgi:exosortase A